MFFALFIILATYLPSNLPPTTEEGQTGTNQCGTAVNQTSMCQNAFSVSSKLFEIFPSSYLCRQRIEVSWCTKTGYGTRVIPDGAIKGAHWLITPDYIQVTGVGDLTKLNIPAGNDGGGELDPHGNPIGGVVFSSGFSGQAEEIFEWTSFLDSTIFCFRICDPKGKNAAAYCQHIYDTLGCDWNMPANYNEGFDTCHADSGEPMGVYGASTFHQGDAVTPDPHPAPQPTNCQTVTTIANGVNIQGTSIMTSGASQPTGGTASSGAVAGGGGSRSGTGSASSGAGSGGAKPTTSGTSAGVSTAGSIQGLERIILSIASALMFSLVGAAVVL
ncbi:hypothetical protein B0H13DRAFT_2233490 [Mycena leptocephala]|nr:hypothetical protein B0H13DRAFT_2233490 [Mycena leptocephala]